MSLIYLQKIKKLYIRYSNYSTAKMGYIKKYLGMHPRCNETLRLSSKGLCPFFLKTSSFLIISITWYTINIPKHFHWLITTTKSTQNHIRSILSININRGLVVFTLILHGLWLLISSCQQGNRNEVTSKYGR